MRIVLDTKSKEWANFKRFSYGILMVAAILFVSATIEHFTGCDLDFATGYICGIHLIKYKWRA